MFEESPVIERLDGPTILGVAERLGCASTFEDFVRRESEMDALFTLADSAIGDGARDTGGGVHATRLHELRDLIFAAHDRTHESDAKGAITLLAEAARIAEQVG